MKNRCSYLPAVSQKLEFFGKKWKNVAGGGIGLRFAIGGFAIYGLRFTKPPTTIPPAVDGGTSIYTTPNAHHSAGDGRRNPLLYQINAHHSASDGRRNLQPNTLPFNLLTLFLKKICKKVKRCWKKYYFCRFWRIL